MRDDFWAYGISPQCYYKAYLQVNKIHGKMRVNIHD